jgi:hypothetical protein
MINFEQTNIGNKRKGCWSGFGDGISGNHLFLVIGMVVAHF